MANDGERPAISLARSLLGRVASTVRAVLPGTGERRSERPPPMPSAAPARASTGQEPAAPSSQSGDLLPAAALHRLADPAFEGVSAIEGETLAIVWRVGEGAIARAQLVAAPGSEMTLRAVRVGWPEGAEGPVVETEDHGSVRSEGTVALAARRAGEKLVVAIGLASPDDAFVAIDHATIG